MLNMSPSTGSLDVLLGAIWAASVAAVIIAVHRLAARIHRRSQSLRPDGITIVQEPAKAEFEIVAVHGLGAHPIHTWEGKPSRSSNTKHHLLKDLFAKDFPTARILSFDYNSDWLVDAPEKTAQEIGKRLLGTLIKHRGNSQRLPIIFVGHSFGGIVIKEALCASHRDPTLLEDTCGIIFLGTPHQGSSLSRTGAYLSWLTSFLGSNTALLLSLQHRETQLSVLEGKFRTAVNGASRHDKIVSIYETKSTFFGWLSVGLVVDQHSATGYAAEVTYMDTDHSGLNKFYGPEDPGYKSLKGKVKTLLVKSLLEQADDYLHKKHYQDGRLDIRRLSGDFLSMEQCYINLAIVKQSSAPTSIYNFLDKDEPTSRFSFFSQQKVETPPEQAQVQLADIFNERQEGSGTKVSPRRVLIRGRAGVGKTTLCKKIVYDFINKKLWNEMFDRVLWVPLRNLKQRAGPGYDLKTLFDHEFFRLSKDETKEGGTRFAKELEKALADDRTLFILDGLDEVAGIVEGDDMFDFLRELLRQSRVIITSRPAVLPHGINVDIELETIGFNPGQVDEYVAKAHGKNVDELKGFLQSHQLVRGLVRIPIQLDAFCYCWDPREGESLAERPHTMTTLYEMIQKSLWKKDAIQLGKTEPGSLDLASQKDVEKEVRDELYFLEHLAFAGLAADKIEFSIDDIRAVNDHLGSSISLGRTLPRLSFLRTSDPSARLQDRLYHFIHLTFQEYFAARYLVRHWTDDCEVMAYGFFNRRNKGNSFSSDEFPSSPVEFIKWHKYDARYGVMWRFVAGLMDAKNESKLTRTQSNRPETDGFFQLIEREPIDLLGPAHQRLVMHCLSEATSLPKEIRKRREDRLLRWVLFECDHLGYSDLARESELSDEVLHAALSGVESTNVLVEALANSGRYLSPKLVDDLMRLLEDEDKKTRRNAAIVLGNQPTLPEIGVRLLIGLDDDADSWVRVSAHEALGKLAKSSEMITSMLLDLIKDTNGRNETWGLAASAFGSQSELSGETMCVLLELLKAENQSSRYAAVVALEGQSSLPENVVTALVELLKDDSENMRRFASRCLGRQSTLPATSMAALLKLLENDNLTVLGNVLWAVGESLNLSERLTIALVRLFKHGRSHIRWYAVFAFRHHKKLSDTTMKSLIELFEDKDGSVRRIAARMAGKDSPVSEQAVAALTALLKDQDWGVQEDAAESLSKYPVLPEATLAALIELCYRDSLMIRVRAANALAQQAWSPEKIPMKLFGDESSLVRTAAAKLVENQSHISETAMDAIFKLLEDEDRLTRQFAIGALGKQPVLSERTLSALRKRLRDKNEDVRLDAARALGNHSTYTLSEPTASELVGLLASENSIGRKDVTKALGKQSKLEETTMSALIELLKNNGGKVSSPAAMAVGDSTELIDRILEAFGINLTTGSKPQVDIRSVSLHHCEYMGHLYTSLLRRGFREQFSLYCCGDRVIVNEPSGLRKAILENNSFRDSILNGRRRLKDVVGHDLWKVLENEEASTLACCI